MFTRSDARNTLILLGLGLVVWLPRLTGPIDLRYDAGVYYILGTSLAQGKGYRLLNEPGEIQAVQYPPLLPAFVAAHQLALGTSDPARVGRWLRASFLVLFACYGLAVYAMARHYLPPAAALLVGGITLLYRHTIFMSDLLFAEVPFALVTVLFVLLHRKGARPSAFVGTALLGVAAYLLRAAGVALLAAWVAEALLRKQGRQAALWAAVALVPVMAWQTYVSRLTSGDEYKHPAYDYQRAPYQYYNVSYAENIVLVDSFVPELGRASLGGLAERALTNLTLMPANLGEGVTGGRGLWHEAIKLAEQRLGGDGLPPWLEAVPNVLLGGLILAGAAALVARREWFIPFYLAASLGLICLTPWPGQFARYMSPLTPFLALFLVIALTAFRDYSRRRWLPGGQKAGAVLTGLVVFGALATELVVDLHAFVVRQRHGLTYAGRADGSRLFYYGPTWEAFDAALAWVNDHAGRDDILATSSPHWAYLHTGRRAVMPPMEADPTEAQRLLETVPAAYVIVDELEFIDIIRRYTVPMIARHPHRWRVVHTVPDSHTRVYQWLGEVGAGPGRVGSANVAPPRGTK